MDPKLESLDINCSADDVAEYIDRFEEELVMKMQLKALFSLRREGSICPAKNFGLAQNIKGRFNCRNSRSTSVTRQARPVRAGRTGEVSHTRPES